MLLLGTSLIGSGTGTGGIVPRATFLAHASGIDATLDDTVTVVPILGSQEIHVPFAVDLTDAIPADLAFDLPTVTITESRAGAGTQTVPALLQTVRVAPGPVLLLWLGAAGVQRPDATYSIVLALPLGTGETMQINLQPIYCSV